MGKGSILNFCSNNYLGLSSHPDVVEAAVEALRTHGAGVSSVRFICGTQDIHKQLEDKISKFHGREDTILYPSCFDANAGLFEQICGPEDAILSDELNHRPSSTASICASPRSSGTNTRTWMTSRGCWWRVRTA